MLLPVGLAYTLTGRLTHLQKVLVGYASLAIFTGIVSTISRGGWIATVLTLLVFFVFLFRQRDYRLQSLLLALALVGVAAGSLGLAKLSEDRKKHLAVENQAKEVRFRIWQPAIAMWKDHLWTGVGPDHFDARFRQYRPGDAELQYRPGRVHNDYLNTLADWGAIGFVLVASVWAAFYWEVFRSWKYIGRAQSDLAARRSNKSSLVLGGALGLLAILLHSFVDFNFHIPANAILAVTLLGLVASYFRFATERYWFTVRLPLKAVVTLVLLAAGSYLGAQSWRHTAESHWLARAEEDSNNVTNRIEDLRHAFEVEPKNFETAYNLGETLRLLSWEGGEGFQKVATQAVEWFQKAIDLNPFDPYSQIRLGMCLDWVGRHADAEPYFAKANALDPNGYYTAAHLGWHYFQVADYPKAQKWFQRSLGLFWADNPISRAYLNILKDKVPEAPKS
jgi:O-antigen ligase